METVISNDDRIAIAEVDYIIHHMNERYLEKIPQNIQDYLTILKKRNLKIYVDPHKPLEKQGLKEFTLYFLMILNLKYWCNDERRKEILFMLENNQRKYEDKINNILNNAESMQGDEPKERPLNRPRQIIVTGTPTFPEKKTEDNSLENNSEEKLEATENTEKKNEEIKEEPNLEEKLKDTAAIANVKKENFFTKFIYKLKAMFVKK